MFPLHISKFYNWVEFALNMQIKFSCTYFHMNYMLAVTKCHKLSGKTYLLGSNTHSSVYYKCWMWELKVLLFIE